MLAALLCAPLTFASDAASLDAGPAKEASAFSTQFSAAVTAGASNAFSAASTAAVETPGTALVFDPVVKSECLISPVYVKTAIGDEVNFTVRCLQTVDDAVAIVPCPNEINWASNAGEITGNPSAQDHARFVAGTQTMLGGFVTASMVFNTTSIAAYSAQETVSCKANVDVLTKAKSCVLLPSSATLEFGEQKRFEALCYSDEIASLPLYTTALTAPTVPCPEFAWTSDAGAISNASSAGATLTAANAGAGKFLEARYTPPASVPFSSARDQFYCSAEITVNAAPEPSATPTPTPTPTPDGGGSGGGGNILLPYTGYNYVNHATSPTPTPSATPAPSASPSPRPPMGKLVIHPATAKPSASPSASPAVAAAGGLTGLFTAQSAPLALGLLLGIIAVVLLWYWLAGGKKAKSGAEGIKGGKNEKKGKKERASEKGEKKSGK